MPWRIGASRVILGAGALVATFVAGVVPSSAQTTGTDPLRPYQWPLDVIGAEVAWGQTMGRGITVAVIDTGVDLAHEDLAAQLVPGNDFVDGDRTPQDVNGHGTHVAGVIAATRGNDLGVVGVAPEARIMPIRALDAEGVGTPAAVIAAVRWAVDNGAAVINLSVTEVTAQGGPFAGSLTSAIEQAWAKGVIVVLASGNDGSGGDTSAPSYEKVPAIVVTATDRHDSPAGYARPVGDAQWAMAAPGGAGNGEISDDVASTYWSRGQSNLYAAMAGTSMAVPHVAGAAALLRSLGLSPAETVDRLLGTARDLGAPGRDAVFGAGRLDLSAAIKGVPQSLQQPGISAPPVSTEATPELIPVTSVLTPVVESPPETSPATVARTPRSMGPPPELPSITVPPTSAPTSLPPSSLPPASSSSEGAQALAVMPEPGGRPSRTPLTMAASTALLVAASACWRSRSHLRRPPISGSG
ncbi:MAG: S8 family serine peptidase [Actinobacteria bacterium]|nr:S8 family serine peptidase [Actinomycetota bacterium]